MSAISQMLLINTFCVFLYENGIAFSKNKHYITELNNRRKRVVWDSGVKMSERERSDDTTYSEYLKILEYRDYSILMTDGGVIQISLDYAGRQPSGYRYAYVPCPIYFSDADFSLVGDETLPFLEFIEDLNHQDLISRLRIRPAFRFEYDPDVASKDHPSCHVHLGKSSSRIPVSRPIAHEQFFCFVFKNFYPNVFASHSKINGLNSRALRETITVEQKRELHFHLSART